MSPEIVKFRVTRLDASVLEGVPIEWRGQQYDSGPLLIELDNSLNDQGNWGVLDYTRRRAQAEFHVQLKFPEFAGILADLGIDPEMTRPVRAVLQSEGEILEDHGLALSGSCELRPHGLFPPQHTAAAVLPGY
jgi:hypothetical protein